MDKFTKSILTIIAIGVVGINLQMLNGGNGFLTKAHSNEPHMHLSYEIIDLQTAIQNQFSVFSWYIEDCKIQEGFANDYSEGSSPFNSWKIKC